VAKPRRLLTDIVPASEAHPSDFAEHLFSSHRPEVFLSVAVGVGGEAHQTLDDRDRLIAQPDFVAGIDDGPGADGGGVGQVSSGNIGLMPDGGIVATGGGAEERSLTTGGGEVAGGVDRERIAPDGSVAAAGGVAYESPVPAGGVVDAGGVEGERTDPGGDVLEAGGVPK